MNYIFLDLAASKEVIRITFDYSRISIDQLVLIDIIFAVFKNGNLPFEAVLLDLIIKQS